jgi:hypothetical protein
VNKNLLGKNLRKKAFISNNRKWFANHRYTSFDPK